MRWPPRDWPTEMSNDNPDHIRAAQAQYRDQLRELAKDRPVHLAYVNACLGAGDVDAPIAPRGMTANVRQAIQDDIEWIIAPVVPGVSQYPHAYRTERQRLARNTALARHRRESGRGLQDFLRISS